MSQRNGHSNGASRHTGSGLVILKNEPRVVTEATVKRLKEQGADDDLIVAATRASKTNPEPVEQP